MAKIGFIGMGNMGHAILKGALKEYPAEEMIFCAKTSETKTKVHAETGVEYTDNNAECANRCKYLVLAVKPQFYEEVLKEIRYMVTPEHVLISLAPGKTIDQLKQNLGNDKRIVRVMPNTPAMIGEGMTGVSVKQGELSGEEMDEIKKLFDACGKTEFIEERLMDAVVCASGSSPAFVYQFIEALADSAVRYGMPRKQAYVFAAQAVKGAAAMVLETGEHPAVLKDQVCSPAGTTIEGVAALEEYGLRNAVLKASEAVYNRCTKIWGGVFVLGRIWRQYTNSGIRWKPGPMIFFAGIIAGVLIAQTKATTADTGLFSEYFLNQYASLSVNIEKLFLYIGGYRISQYLAVVCAGFLQLAPAILTGLIFLTGMLWGTMAGISVIQLGGKGLMICVAGLFPQILFYVPAFGWVILWTSCGGSNRKKYVFLAALGLFFLFFGVACEAALNPGLVRQILRKI